MHVSLMQIGSSSVSKQEDHVTIMQKLCWFISNFSEHFNDLCHQIIPADFQVQSTGELSKCIGHGSWNPGSFLPLCPNQKPQPVCTPLSISLPLPLIKGKVLQLLPYYFKLGIQCVFFLNQNLIRIILFQLMLWLSDYIAFRNCLWPYFPCPQKRIIFSV